MAGCSIAVVTTDVRSPTTAPRIARLLASVPPPVNRISSGRAPISSATSARARSIAARAARPSGLSDDGLPKAPRRNGSIASSTSGSTGVVALKSR